MELCILLCMETKAKNYERLKTDTVHDRIARLITKTDNCWLWEGAMNNGSPNISFEGRRVNVCRVQAAVRIGRELVGTEWTERFCLNPFCVRPDHMRLMTPDNESDAQTRRPRRSFRRMWR